MSIHALVTILMLINYRYNRRMKKSEKFIYLDQAATSWPKPEVVGHAMLEAVNVAGSPSRSAHTGARAADRLLSSARKTVAQFLRVSNPSNLVFVPSATFGLNMVIRGRYPFYSEWKEGKGRFIFHSSTEHNAVTRTLWDCVLSTSAGKEEIDQLWVQLQEMATDHEGRIRLDLLERRLKSGTYSAIVCQHGSNVSGVFQPIKELASLCRKYEVDLIVDGSQTAGHIPINLDEYGGLCAWICSGHKGLLGPAGSGLAYLAEDFYPLPLVTGGTGSGEARINYRPADYKHADNHYSPPEKPHDYEAGTPPLPAIAGLAAGIEHLSENFDEDYQHTQQLTEYMLSELQKIEGVKILGLTSSTDSKSLRERLPLASLVIEGKNSDEVTFLLDSQYSIATRAGLHCAPYAHGYFREPYENYELGALRFSWNASNTFEELGIALDALKAVISR